MYERVDNAYGDSNRAKKVLQPTRNKYVYAD